MVKQIFRSKVKNQGLFDQIFLTAAHRRLGRKTGKCITIDSNDLCHVFLELSDAGSLDPFQQMSIRERCAVYVESFPITVIVND